MPHVFEEREKEEKRGSILPVTISRIRTLIEVQTVIRIASTYVVLREKLNKLMDSGGKMFHFQP